MPRVRYSWELLTSLETAQEYEEFQDLEFCCSRVAHTDPARRCLICGNCDHVMVERRIQCISKTCKLYGACKYAWKVWQCENASLWRIYHNGVDHVRDKEIECQGRHKAPITAEMRKFILQQDECAIPPQLILSNMRHASDIIEPKRGYPTQSQVTNCAKYLRKLQGTKNSVHAIRELARKHPFNPTGNHNQAFLFGFQDDANGNAYVGKGTDTDSFVVGVTSIALVMATIEYASESRFTLFHADATFKLSDLGYPVITCGFSDAARKYQLGAIFIVSRRTAKEYAMCLGAFVRVIKRKSFITYFTSQWLDGRYWRWQIFHTPTGFATTNNPCETYNAVMKKYTGRRRYHMQRLISVTQVMAHDAVFAHPTTEAQIQAPSAAAVRAASAMIANGRVVAFSTDNPSLCRVKQLSRDEVSTAQELEELCLAIDGPFDAKGEMSTEEEDPNLILSPALLVREQRSRAAKLYKNVVTWSLKYVHSESMPEGGWIVDVDKCVCGCKYYAKFRTCCHILVGRKASKLGRPGADDKSEKLFNRQIRKVKSTESTISSKKQRRDEPTDGGPTALPLEQASQGRPLLASRALDMQYILCPDT